MPSRQRKRSLSSLLQQLLEGSKEHCRGRRWGASSWISLKVKKKNSGFGTKYLTVIRGKDGEEGLHKYHPGRT